MNKKSKAIEYYDYLVKTNPNTSVHLKYYIRVYDDNCIEASSQPFLLEKECIYSVVEYVMISGTGFNTHVENVQLYFNNDGETFEYAPFENGQLKVDLRQNLVNQAKVVHLEELLHLHKDLIYEIKKLVTKP